MQVRRTALDRLTSAAQGTRHPFISPRNIDRVRFSILFFCFGKGGTMTEMKWECFFYDTCFLIIVYHRLFANFPRMTFGTQGGGYWETNKVINGTCARSPCRGSINASSFTLIDLGPVSSVLVGLCDYQPTCYFILYWGLQSRTVIWTHSFLVAKLFFFVCRRLRAREVNLPLCTRRVGRIGSWSLPLWSPSWLQPTLLGGGKHFISLCC